MSFAANAGAKAKLVASQLAKLTGKQVTLRDTHNLIAKAKEQNQTRTLQQLLQDLEMQKQAYVGLGCIPNGDSNELKWLFLQTRKMKRYFEQFPEVVNIDDTFYNVRYLCIPFLKLFLTI